MDRSNFAAEWCQHRNNTVAVPGSELPNPITHPFDTETDSDPDPDLDSDPDSDLDPAPEFPKLYPFPIVSPIAVRVV
ncbi:MAG: hypothetical protein ACOX52_19035 [Verrucomicrobiota bacterium]|jgi:hypothetical protein